jgi:hypothetical protein
VPAKAVPVSLPRHCVIGKKQFRKMCSEDARKTTREEHFCHRPGLKKVEYRRRRQWRASGTHHMGQEDEDVSTKSRPDCRLQDTFQERAHSKHVSHPILHDGRQPTVSNRSSRQPDNEQSTFVDFNDTLCRSQDDTKRNDLLASLQGSVYSRRVHRDAHRRACIHHNRQGNN